MADATTDETPSWLKSADEEVVANQAVEVQPIAADVPYAPSWVATESSSTSNATTGPSPPLNDAVRNAALDIASQEAQMRAAGFKKDLGKMPRAWLAMRVINPLVAILLICVVFSKLTDLPFFEKFDAWVISIYLLVFALLILCFEGFGTFNMCASLLARNFGFMYTIPGRLGFMVMAGVLACSLQNNFAYAVCAITIIAAAYNGIVMAIYMDWTQKMMEDHQKAARQGK